MTTPRLVRNESLRRGLLVLRAVARADSPITAAQVARAAGLPGATVARLLATLADEGMVIREASRWLIGPGIAELAGTDRGIVALVMRASEVLRRLAEETGESALLTRVTLPDKVEVLVQEDADRLLGVTRWVGRVFDPRRSVSGWIVAAALDEGAVTPPHGTAEDRRDWSTGIAGARTRGYAIDVGGLEAGLTSLAVTVPAGVPGITVGVAGPSTRLTEGRIAAVVERMHAAARALVHSH